MNTGLLCLIEALQRRGYRFVTTTPATHARIVARPDRQVARSVEDVLGWSLPFARGAIDGEIFALLEKAEALTPAAGGMLRSKVRVSSLKGGLYLHSAYPTDDEHAVFFGPDSYRFADLIEAELAMTPAPDRACIVDIGTGSGVGAIVAGTLCRSARIVMTDINPAALRVAALNAQAAGIAALTMLGADLDGIKGTIDLALANPPYLMDASDRAYRNGGDMLGGALSLDMARMAVARLAPGGRLILYTGSAIGGGKDLLGEKLHGLAVGSGCAIRYREIDPDVFGEELDEPAYATVDRIALVAAILTKA